MIDSHTHLDSCAPPNDELVAAAVEAGVDHLLTVGMDLESCRSALQAAEAFPQVYAAIGRHPNVAGGFDPGDVAEHGCERLGLSAPENRDERAAAGDERLDGR